MNRATYNINAVVPTKLAVIIPLLLMVVPSSAT